MHISPSNLTFPLCICLELPKLRTAKSGVLFYILRCDHSIQLQKKVSWMHLCNSDRFGEKKIGFWTSITLECLSAILTVIAFVTCHFTELFSCPNVLFPFVAIPDQTETQMV